MLHDRIEDLSSSQGATIRYLLSAVSKSTVQTTLTTLEQFCNRSVEYHRFTIKCTIGALLSSPIEERAFIALQLVNAALERANSLTLVASALDEAPFPVTPYSLVALMGNHLLLPSMQQIQFCMALVLGSASCKSVAFEFLKKFRVPQECLKEEDGGVRYAALLTRQMGTLQYLDAQLAPVSGTTLFPPSSSVDSYVSVAGVLREMGTGNFVTVEDVTELLSIFPNKVSERDLAEVLGLLASQGVSSEDKSTGYATLLAASGKTASCPKPKGNAASNGPMIFLDAMNLNNPSLDWDQVLRQLDRPNEEPFRLKNISIIFDAYYKFASQTYPPLGLFLGRWKNVRRQRGAVEYILRHPDKVDRTGHIAEAPAELLPTVKPAGMAAAELELWRTFSFVETAVHVASRDREFDAEVFRPTSEKLPLLFSYILMCGNFTGTIKNFTAAKHLLTSSNLSLDMIGSLVIPEAEKRGRLDTVIGLLSELTVTVPSRTVDVLEMVLKCKAIVKRVLKGSGNPRLVVAIAICMDEAGEPSDQWLQKALDGKLHFRTGATENRFSVAMHIVEVAEMLLDKQLYVSSATFALTTLIGSPLKDLLKDVVECARALLASTNSLFPEDVENEATEFFKKMYADGNTTSALAYIEKLLRSTDSRDKQLYACIVTIMFDESRAIACYPRKELQLFSVLYGQMIAKEFLPAYQQQRAWGLLLPCIAKPINYALEEYGVLALEQIKPRIADWPQYGRALRHVKDLDFRVPGIMAAINRGIKQDEAARNPHAAERVESAVSGQSMLPVADPAIVAATPNKTSQNGASAAQLHTHDISTLLTNKNVIAPPRVIQEQINFLIGNTDVNNVDNNARELSTQLRPEYYEYFSDYLVVKRAALEPNYHNMYIDLINKLKSKDLERTLRSATIAAVKRLLASHKIRTDTSERVLLRNLGSWLGTITIEKNIPLLQQELSLRELLYQGMREGKLIAVVAFITRVLNSCAKSRFFCCPNPWTMAQLCMLLEMYELPYLKITLRFEVELLCKNLEVTLQDVDQYRTVHAPHTIKKAGLADILKEIDITDSLDFRVDEGESTAVEALQQQLSANSQSPQLRSSARPLQASAEPFQPREVSVSSPAVQSLNTHLDLPPRPPIVITPEKVRVSEEDQRYFGTRLPEFRQLLAAALRTAVDIGYNSFVARSVNVVVLSSYNIIVKDFARSPVPEEMLAAGEVMSRSLAASLCFATVREVLPELLMKETTLLVDRLCDPITSAEQNVKLKASIVENNEDLCQRALEYHAGEEAAKALRVKLTEAAREKTTALANNEPLPIPQDQIDAQDLLYIMGDALAPTGRMPAAHKEIYTDFFNCMPIVSLFHTSLRTIEEVVSKYYGTEGYTVLDMASPQFMEGNNNELHTAIRQRVLAIVGIISPEAAIYFVRPVFSKIMALAGTIDRLTKELSKNQTAEAPSGEGGNNVRSMHIASLLHQVYLFVLQDCLERGGEPVREEFTRLYLKHEHRYSYSKLTTDLMRVRILQYSRIDEDLAKALTTGVPSCVGYAGEMITSVIIKDRLATSKDMKKTLAALDTIARTRNMQRIAQAAPSPSHVTTLPLSKLVHSSVTQLVLPTTLTEEDKSSQVRSLLDQWIAMWSRKSQRHAGDERNPSVDFVKTLQQNGMLDTSSLAIFLGLSIRFCVEHYATTALALERENPEYAERSLVGSKPGAPPPYHTPYSAAVFTKCDGFTDLVLILLRCCSLRYEVAREQRAETTLLKRVLEMFIRVLTSHHDAVATRQFPKEELPDGTAYIPVFLQQPYVRLLSNLLITIQRQELNAQRETSDEITTAFQTVLHRLQPTEFPAFAFGWLELVSHRIFVPRCMNSTDMWRNYADLLVDALRFIEFLLQGNAISPNGLVFYKSVFKLMLVLLHDFPRFLITYHYPLCDAIPSCCVQMLNTVLCSFPAELRLPEPFQHIPSDNADMLTPVSTSVQKTCIRTTFSEFPASGADLSALTKYVAKDDETIPESVMKSIVDVLSVTPRWTLMNAVVLHAAITYLDAHNNNILPNFGQSNAVRFYRYLAVHFDTKHRYHFLCSCANHLRYPNVQTNFFAKIFFHLFSPDANTDFHTQTCIQEQITRVVAEKTVIMQPHPWGVLNTFVELMRNADFHFWEKNFIHTPHLEHVFTKLKKTLESRNVGGTSQQVTSSHAQQPSAHLRQPQPQQQQTRRR